MECGESPAIGWTSAWISSWTTTSPANKSRKVGSDIAGVMSRERRDEKPKHCHYRCRDDTDRQCEKILEPGRRRLAQ